MRTFVIWLVALVTITASPAQAQVGFEYLGLLEYEAGVECLYREIGPLIESKGYSVTALPQIAGTTGYICSQAMRERLLREGADGPFEGRESAAWVQLGMQQRAYAIGLELKKSRSAQQPSRP